MLLTVWRHGESAPGSPDRERCLTEQGAADVARSAATFVDRLRHSGLALPSLVLFSRWLRTTQTAQGICAAIPGVTSQPLEALIPDSTSAAAERAVAAHVMSETHVHRVLVSHQPLVSLLVNRWLDVPGQVPAMAPGAYAVLELPIVAPGYASLLWSSTPTDDEL